MRSTTCFSWSRARECQRATEVLLGEDVGRVERPRGGYLDVQLLEGNRPIAEVRDASVAPVPDDLVVGMTILGGEEAAKSNT